MPQKPDSPDMPEQRTPPYTDPYAVLGLSPTATSAEIKGAYFALVRAHPPERDPETFKRVRAAYESVRDPAARVEADMRLLRPWPAPARAARPVAFDLSVHREDVIDVARSVTDLARTDWHEHYKKVAL